MCSCYCRTVARPDGEAEAHGEEVAVRGEQRVVRTLPILFPVSIGRSMVLGADFRFRPQLPG